MLFCLRKGKVDLAHKSIVFLHGFLGCSNDWINYLEYFSAQGYSTIAIDLPGHGRSGICEFDQLFKKIPKDSHIVGYSMGGRIALQLSYLRPDWFSSLTLISTNPGLKREVEIKNRLVSEDQWIKKLRSNSIESFINEWYDQSLFTNYTPNRKRFTQNRENLIIAFRKFSIAKLPSLWGYLPHVHHPLQMVFGALDQKFMEVKKEIEKIDIEKRIKILISLDTSHPVHLEAPYFLINAISEFVGKLNKND